MTKQSTKSNRLKEEKKNTSTSKPKSQKQIDEIVMNRDDFNFGGLAERDLKKNLGCG
jgi:hypothetical protein